MGRCGSARKVRAVGESLSGTSLLARLQRRRPELEQAILARVYAVADPRGVSDPEYALGIREAVSAGVNHWLSLFESPDEAPVPPTLLAQARYAARSDVELDTVLRRYFAGYTLLAEFLVGEAEAGLQIEPEELKRLTRSQAVLFDRLVAAVAGEYRREAEDRVRSIDAGRAERVRALLAGEPIDLGGLGYEFADGWHFGAAAAGPGARAALRDLSGRLDRSLLLVDGAGGSVWAWFGGARPVGADEARATCAVHWPTQVALGLGEPGKGLVGWRQTHRQALAALPVAIHGSVKQVSYIDCALLASVLADEVLASSLRARYLVPLRSHRDGGEALRRTLNAYFAAERNVSSAAAALGVSRQTVKNRLCLAEEIIGRSLPDCASDLEIALQLGELDFPVSQGDYSAEQIHIADRPVRRRD